MSVLNLAACCLMLAACIQMGVFGKPSVEEAPAVTKELEKKHPTPAEVRPGAQQVGMWESIPRSIIV